MPRGDRQEPARPGPTFDRATFERLLTYLLPPSNQLVRDAGVPDIGRQRYGTQRRVRPATQQQEDQVGSDILKYVTKRVNPEAFHDALSRMPLSVNIEDRRSRYDPDLRRTRGYPNAQDKSPWDRIIEEGIRPPGIPRPDPAEEIVNEVIQGEE